jgi:protoheme IX farnesyltransferase
LIEAFRIWNSLTKPRVTVLILATVLPGLYLGNETSPSWQLTTITLIGTYLMSSASFIFNQYIERESDARMYRTKLRALPGGKILPLEALILGFIVTILAFLFLLLCKFTNSYLRICCFSFLCLVVYYYP